MPKQSFLFAGIAGHARRPEDNYLLGIFRRDTGSGDWEHVLTEVETFTVLVHPADPNLVFAGTSDGVYFSLDRGKSFQRAGFPERGFQVWSILVDPRNSRLLYAGCSPVAVFRSNDNGATWTRLPEPAVPSHTVMPFPCRVMRMAAHPHREGEIYAVPEANGVMRSKDGGESWQDCSTDLIRLAQQPHLRSRIVSDTENEGMLDGHAICTTSADPDAIIVAVRMGLFRSSDEGEHWEDMEVSRFSPTRYSRDIRVSPQDPKTLYAALSVAFTSKDGGVYRSQDAGRTWHRFDKIQVHGTIMSIALNPDDAQQVYVGARFDGEVFGTQDGGES